MSANNHFTGKVLKGDQHGRQLGFATLNFDPVLWPDRLPVGVHVALVSLDAQDWLGALYYGSRLIKQESTNVLEIHVLNFDRSVYNRVVQVQIGPFVRPPLSFPATTNGEKLLRQQLGHDVEQVLKLGKQQWPEIQHQ